MNRDYGHDAATTHNDAAMQVVMVGLGDEKFALDAGLVREIIDPIPATRVAGARSFVPSVINVRGNVIPLADLRIRFGNAHER
jgi:purine-binding chemotaxis protein CheW